MVCRVLFGRVSLDNPPEGSRNTSSESNKIMCCDFISGITLIVTQETICWRDGVKKVIWFKKTE